jgi:hypothetical protein
LEGGLLQTEWLGKIKEDKKLDPVDLGLEWYTGLRKVHEGRNGVKDYTEKNLVKTWGVLRNSDLNIKRLHAKKNVDVTMGWGQSEPPKKHNPEAWSRLTGGVLETTGPAASGGRPRKLEEKDKMFRRNVYGFDGRFERTQDITSPDVKKTIDKYHRSTVQDEKRLRKMELVIMQKERQKKQEKAKATLKAKQTAMMKKLWPEGQPGAPVQNNFLQSDTFEQSQTTDPRFIQVGNMTIDRFHWLVEGTIQEYSKDHPDDFDFIYPEKLHAYWAKLPQDQKKNLQLTISENILIDGKKVNHNAKETFDNYFRTRVEYLMREAKDARGFESYDAKGLFNYYKNTWPDDKKRHSNLVFPSAKNAIGLFDYFLRDIKASKDRKMDILMGRSTDSEFEKSSAYGRYGGGLGVVREEGSKGENEANRRRQNEIQRKAKEALEQRQKERCRPKDKFKRGKVLLNLSLRYPNDRILMEMAVREFEDYHMGKAELDYQAMSEQFDADVASSRGKDK